MGVLLMRINNDTRIIVGPPGTGKTRHLIELAKTHILEGCPANQIGYISFTRQAVREARERILAAAPHIPKEEFIGFRTLHSLMFWLTGKKHTHMITADEEFDIAITAITGMGRGPQEAAQVRHYSFLYNYARLLGISFSEAWNQHPRVNMGTELDYLEWVKSYTAYKKATRRIDFKDLTDEFIEKGIQFPFRYLFLDESQDFSTDAWAAVSLLARCAGRVYAAGDSDQAIYEWAGAKGSLFDQLEGERTVLEHSYRVPQVAHTFATRLLKGMRREILYKPTSNQGSVHSIREEEVPKIINKEETYLLLCRNNFQIKRIKAMLYSHKIWYKELAMSEKFGNDGRMDEDKLQRRIRWYESGNLSNFQHRELSKLVPDLDSCLRHKVPWYEAFVAVPQQEIDFYRATRPQWANPKVFLGTFHSAKGLEADNVILYSDCSKAVYKNRFKLAELKVLYVAITRTKNRLYFVQPTMRHNLEFWRLQDLENDIGTPLLF